MEQSRTTEIKTTEARTSWTIKGFSAVNAGCLTSPTFTVRSVHSSQTASWCYKLCPNVQSEINLTTFWTTLDVVVMEQNEIMKFYADVEVEFKSVKAANLNTSGMFDGQQKTIGSQMKIKQESLSQHLLVQDDLTLCINVSLHEEFVVDDRRERKQQSEPDPLLLDHFANLLTNAGKFSDTTVIVGQQEFPVHRAILAVRSPVFAAMFEHTEMKESQKNQVIIKDIEPHVFQEVLRFIYTDTVQQLDKMAHELLAAADKYALEKLRTVCEEFLGKSLAVETVTQTLHLADMHHAMKLRHEAIEFIARNITEMQTTDWKSLLVNNPDVAAEMFSELTKRASYKRILSGLHNDDFE